MKRVLNYLKMNRIPVPIKLGLALAKIPYTIRPGLGKSYREQRKAIAAFKVFDNQEKEAYIFKHFKRVFTHAYKHIKFYNELYTRHSIAPCDLRTFEDIQHVPLISKKDLIDWDIEDRSYPVQNRMLVNTGGSSGRTLSFYMDPSRYGNEWAHIHDMWSKYGFRASDLKLSFDGRAKEGNKIVYDFARNSYLYDIYADPQVLGEQLKQIFSDYKVKYLHGYPSAIYEFANYCKTDKVLLAILRQHLKAAFLSSEFPSPHYRSSIEEIFGIETQAFYGHTETCVLAVETEKFIYHSYQTYGHAEMVENDGKIELVGTSYFNFASPLIRYNTEDLIEPLDGSERILSKFKIKEGRVGEYVLDKSEKKIPLTGLIYGRHHELFDVTRHIQIYQQRPGYATILYVGKEALSPEKAKELFNAKNIDIIFDFSPLDSPILSSAGKVNLLVHSIPSSNY